MLLETVMASALQLVPIIPVLEPVGSNPSANLQPRTPVVLLEIPRPAGRNKAVGRVKRLRRDYWWEQGLALWYSHE